MFLLPQKEKQKLWIDCHFLFWVLLFLNYRILATFNTRTRFVLFLSKCKINLCEVNLHRIFSLFFLIKKKTEEALVFTIVHYALCIWFYLCIFVCMWEPFTSYCFLCKCKHNCIVIYKYIENRCVYIDWLIIVDDFAQNWKFSNRLSIFAVYVTQ